MKRFALLLLVLMCWITSAFGQQPTYRLRIDDVISVQIYNIDNVKAELQVGKDGNVTPPFIGVIKAEGLTTKELEAEMARQYSKVLRIRDPRVSVIILRFRATRVTVGPAVLRPGQVELRPGDTVLDAINAAGSYVQNGGTDLRHGTLRRAGSRELIPLDLYSLFIKGDMSQNYTLEDGDSINVPENQKNYVYALGEIQSQGPVPFKEGITVAEVLAMRNGAIPFSTKLSRTIVNRERAGLPGQYEQIVCDIAKFFNAGDASQNISLQPGDIVYFSKSNTPDVNRISGIASGLANFFYILDRFGIKILK